MLRDPNPVYRETDRPATAPIELLLDSCWFVGRTIGQLACCSTGWLAGWSVGWWVCRLIGRLAVHAVPGPERLQEGTTHAGMRGEEEISLTVHLQNSSNCACQFFGLRRQRGGRPRRLLRVASGLRQPRLHVARAAEGGQAKTCSTSCNPDLDPNR